MAGAGCRGTEKVNCASRKANFAAGIAAGAYCVKGPGRCLWLRARAFNRGASVNGQGQGAGSQRWVCAVPHQRGGWQAGRLLPGRHWPQFSPACPSSWPGHRQVSLPSQALGQQHFAILLLWSIPLPRRRNQVLALPISAGR